MKTVRLLGFAAMFGAVAVVSADAQSLKLRERMAHEDTELVALAEAAGKACDTKLEVKFDWTGVPEDKIDTNSPSGYCDAALGGIRHICESAIGKSAVKEKVKSVSCGFAAQRAISLKDGAIDYKISFDSSNDADYVYEFLQKNL